MFAKEVLTDIYCSHCSGPKCTVIYDGEYTACLKCLRLAVDILELAMTRGGERHDKKLGDAEDDVEPGDQANVRGPLRSEFTNWPTPPPR